MHCDVNAFCLLIRETGEFRCQCKTGFNGTGHACTDVCLNYCDNKGICLKDIKGEPSCRCSGSFTGKRCTEKSEFFYVTGGIAFGVLLLIIIVLLVWMICVRYESLKISSEISSNYNFSLHQVIQEERAQKNVNSSHGSEWIPSQFLLRYAQSRLCRIHSPVASQHLRALLRRRGGWMGNAKFL